jgi:hypothetical protein
MQVCYNVHATLIQSGTSELVSGKVTKVEMVVRAGLRANSGQQSRITSVQRLLCCHLYSYWKAVNNPDP